jgi:hypothetical protein
MKKFIQITFPSVLVVGLVVTLVILRPFNPIVDKSRFHSSINRIVPDTYYLPILLDLENISGNNSYFDQIKGGNLEDILENITLLIEREELFLNNYNPDDFIENGPWPYHAFNYSAKLTLGPYQGEFTSIIQIHPTFMFYLNFSTQEYLAVTYFNSSTQDQELWMIEEIYEYIISESSTLLFVNQTMVISDIYAPLAGTGTEFTRYILCLPDGQPAFFLSDEGAWWIS